MRQLQVPGPPPIVHPLLYLEAGHPVAVVDGPWRGARGIVVRRTEGRPDLVRYSVKLERYRKHHWLTRAELAYCPPAHRTEAH